MMSSMQSVSEHKKGLGDSTMDNSRNEKKN